MEGLASRVPSSHILPTPPNLAVSTHYAVSTQSTHCGQQQLQDKLPPSYEEAQMAAQSADLPQIGNIESDKMIIYRHPMFPLLAMLFEKCEQATQTSDCPTSQTFDNDIKDYILQHHREGKPFYSDDPDLDGLMMKAIQVLRIHLLELEKVNELCKDFCQRYIACLKGKMQSENLLRSPMSAYSSTAVGIMSPSLSPLANLQPQPTQQTQQQQQQQSAQQQQQQVYIPQQLYYTQTVTPCTVAMPTPTASTVIGSQEQPQQQQSQQVVAAVAYTPQNIAQVTQQGQQIVVTQVPQVSHVVPQTQQQLVAPTSLTFTNQPNLTAMSLASAPSTPTTTSTPIQVGSPAEIIVPSTVPLPALDSPTDSTDNKKKSAKRGILPKQATNIMKTWLFQHLVHPYPTEDEKRAIAAQTNLTILQVNNWFINARRRILQPMLDASNPEGAKAKKSKIQSRPAQRFWPESLVPSQYNTVPIAPAPVSSQSPATGTVPIAVPAGIAMPGTVHVQPGVAMQAIAVPSGSIQNVVGLPAGVSVPSGVSVPPGMIPTTINMPHNVHPGSIVVVTLPPNANAVPVSSEMDGNIVASTAMTTTATSSQPEVVPSDTLSPILAAVRQDSPALQNSPLPTMAQNGGDSRLVGSPTHIPTSHVDSLAVEGLSMDTTSVASGLVS